MSSPSDRRKWWMTLVMVIAVALLVRDRGVPPEAAQVSPTLVGLVAMVVVLAAIARAAHRRRAPVVRRGS